MLDQLVTMCQSIPVEERIALVYSSLSPHFQDELYPVIAEAQKLVPRPENLDLESWIGSPFPTFDQALLASPSDSDTDAGVEADRKEAESLASFIEMVTTHRFETIQSVLTPDRMPKPERPSLIRTISLTKSQILGLCLTLIQFQSCSSPLTRLKKAQKMSSTI